MVFEKFQPENVFRACNNIGQPRPAAQRGRHREVSNEKQRTDHGEQSSLRSRGGINSSAIGKIPTDDRVVDSDQAGQDTDGENDGQGRKTGGKKCQADDIRLARTPITVEQSRGALPIHVSGAVHAPRFSND